MSTSQYAKQSAVRAMLLAGLFGLAGIVLLWRVADLHLLRSGFLQDHADARHLRIETMHTYRGMILDRNGEPLAVSTPVSSVWANPRQLLTQPDLSALSGLLETDERELREYLEKRREREFVYIRRHADPHMGKRVMELGYPGVAIQKEFRRYYPAGEIASHVVGFTDVNDVGQEGMELVFEDQLRGVPGKKRVIRDRLGRTVEDVESLVQPQPGRDVFLSIDRRIQYLAYRELKAAVNRHHAQGGSLVMLDAATGEVLAMVNQPAFNPNRGSERVPERIRNRAVTDLVEPGSTVKPFIIISALQQNVIGVQTLIDTSPGFLQIGRHRITDHGDNGKLSPTGILRKSSNVGASKVALATPAEDLWGVLSDVGFGVRSQSGLPGESAGRLRDVHDWREIDRATVAFGYGLSVTTLQLARAYMLLANNGLFRPVRITRMDGEPDPGARVLPAGLTRTVRGMLQAVIQAGGTGELAGIKGYHVAGKTGTVRKSVSGGYSSEDYVALFAGIAPASRPRLVMAITIDQPTGDDYYGGRVAAPVFARVMEGALRLLNISPDDRPASRHKTVLAVSPDWPDKGSSNDGG